MAEVSDTELRGLLKSVKKIAVVGVSANPIRPSYFVARYLQRRGYAIVPVNPGLAGQELFEEEVRASLTDCPDDIDMVDIFRKPEAVPALVDEALARWPELTAVWMQIGVTHEEAAEKARARGVTVVQNRCPKIEYQRLFHELRMGGFNTGRISSKLD